MYLLLCTTISELHRYCFEMASWAPELPGIQAVLEYLAEVHKLKEQGNDKFKNGDFDEAQQIYTECLDLVKDLEATPLSPREFNPLLVMKTSILNNRSVLCK